MFKPLLKSARQWILQRHWGRWYCGLAVVSAMVFIMLPAGSFYAPNVPREQEWIAPRIEHLTHGFQGAVSDELAARSAQQRPFPSGLLGTFFVPVRFMVTELMVSAVHPLDSGIVTVDANATVQDVSSTVTSLAIIPVQFNVTVLSPAVSLQEKVRPGYGVGLPVEASKPDETAMAVVDAVFGTPQLGEPNNAPPTGHGNLSAGQALLQESEALIAIEGGEPKEAPGEWVRMSYMSISTITTLGLGDILPLSTWARMCVMFEALFGVIFAGLFLSSIAIRLEERLVPQRSEGPDQKGHIGQA
jgi:hypothetical protein